MQAGFDRRGRHDEVRGGQRLEVVVGIKTGGLAHLVGRAADVLQVVDVLEQAPVSPHRVAHLRRERATHRFVRERVGGFEQRHRLAVDDLPVVRNGRAERFVDLAGGDAPERALEREPRGSRDPGGEVDRLRVERIGRPHRDGNAQRDVQRRLVPALRRSVDDVVMHERAQVQQLHRRRAADRGVAVSAAGQHQHQTGPVTGAGRRGRREHAGDGLAEGCDDAPDPAIDVALQERLVRHGA